MALGRHKRTRLSSYKAPGNGDEHDGPEAREYLQECNVCLMQENSSNSRGHELRCE